MVVFYLVNLRHSIVNSSKIYILKILKFSTFNDVVVVNVVVVANGVVLGVFIVNFEHIPHLLLGLPLLTLNM